MSNNNLITQNRNTLKNLLAAPATAKRIEEIVGKNAASFCASIIQIQTSNDYLAKVNPQTILTAAVTAATLNLPINNALGFAYIVPYKGQAQFQLGYKGLIQLAIRSGQVKHIGASEIYACQIVKLDKLTVNQFDFSKEPAQGEKPVGYAAHLELTNGYTVSAYMTVAEIQAHAAKFSQTYNKGSGVWYEHFDAMALKTVMKKLLAKYAPLSIEMQNAIVADQAVIREIPPDDNIINHAEIIDYVDNEQNGETVSNAGAVVEDDLNALIHAETTEKTPSIQDGLLL